MIGGNIIIYTSMFGSNKKNENVLLSLEEIRPQNVTLCTVFTYFFLHSPYDVIYKIIALDMPDYFLLFKRWLNKLGPTITLCV